MELETMLEMETGETRQEGLILKQKRNKIKSSSWVTLLIHD